MATPSTSSPYACGLITVAIGLKQRIIVGTDHTLDTEALGIPGDVSRIVEIRDRFLVAGCGIWATADAAIDFPRDVLAAARPEDTAQSFLQRYDRMFRARLERFLTRRFEDAADVVLRECFSPLTPPQSLIVMENTSHGGRLTVFEYIPTLTSDDTIILTPLMQGYDVGESGTYVAVGASAPFIATLDTSYVTHAIAGPNGPEHAARLLVEEALLHTPRAFGPALVRSFPVPHSEPRVTIARSDRVSARATAIGPAPFPPVDTGDIFAVQQFVHERFNTLFPHAQFSWLPVVFQDIERLFGGKDPDYAAVDLRYHDLEHTLQATVCLTQLLDGRHAARVVPRIDAHHFELAIAAVLLHDTGYLRLRSDRRGTGAKYTFCHVLRSCAFAASYLPTLGAGAQDVEVVIGAINCTGPRNEVSRLRFDAPVDEIIGCAVATADYLGQMAAADYPDELGILFDEFEESDNFFHVPAEDRMFKSAHELASRTPQFWHRYVLPKLDTDFHGLYQFLAQPYPGGRNPYLEAIEGNIAEIQRRLAARRPFSAEPYTASVGPAAASLTVEHGDAPVNPPRVQL